MKLILGSGGTSMEGWVTVDNVAPADIIADLNKEWPWVDDSIEQILMIDVIEHLENSIFVFNEASRILKKNGVLRISVPSTDGRGSFQDPSHIRYFNSNSWRYYCNNCQENKRFGRSLGIFTSLVLYKQEERLGGDNVIHSEAIFVKI